MIGFLTMLISLNADARTKGVLTEDNLGLAQAEVWQKITGLHEENIGEQICVLSASREPRFLLGCSNGRQFYAAGHGALDMDDETVAAHYTRNFDARGDGTEEFHQAFRLFGPYATQCEVLWKEYFEDFAASS